PRPPLPTARQTTKEAPLATSPCLTSRQNAVSHLTPERTLAGPPHRPHLRTRPYPDQWVQGGGYLGLAAGPITMITSRGWGTLEAVVPRVRAIERGRRLRRGIKALGTTTSVRRGGRWFRAAWARRGACLS